MKVIDSTLTFMGGERVVASQRIGYVRVSSLDQNPERQLDGIALDKIFTDKASAKDTKRPQLHAALNHVRPGGYTCRPLYGQTRPQRGRHASACQGNE